VRPEDRFVKNRSPAGREERGFRRLFGEGASIFLALLLMILLLLWLAKYGLIALMGLFGLA
jgi:hypothetical protein